MSTPTLIAKAARALLPVDAPVTAAASRSVRVTAGATRTIEGDAVEYGVVGSTSIGPLIYLPGSITVPAEMSRVKLLVQHDDRKPGVGILQSFSEGARFAQARFYLPEGEAGDEALDQAAKGLRDGLSVTCAIKKYSFDDADNIVVESAELIEISLVTIPAFANAGVTRVAANREDPSMPEQQLAEPVVAVAAQPAPAAPQAPAPLVVEAQAAPPAPLGQTAARGPRTLAEASAMIVAHLRAGGSPAEVGRILGSTINLASAANGLADIVPGHDRADAIMGPQFIGEAWQASRTDRPVIDAISGGRPETLTSDRIDSWRYQAPQLRDAEGVVTGPDTANGTTAGPEVREYAGNKAAVHTNKWETVPATFPIYRNAGGWDFDRIYVDLGNVGYINSVLRKAIDDSRSDAERYVLLQLLANATDLPAQTSVPAALATLGTRAATIGAKIDYISMAADAWGEFVNLGADEVPWWLQKQGEINLSTTNGNAGGLQFSVNPELASGSIVAGDARATSFYEVNPPVAVQALNIANGGIDLGVYGYVGLAVHDTRAIFATTVA